jgi:competence protein ComEC
MAAALIAFAWLLGVGTAALADGDWAALVAAASLFAAATFAWRTRPRRKSGAPEAGKPWLRRDVGTLTIIVLGVATVFLAGWRYDAAPTPDLSLARLNDGAVVQLRAVVSDEPEERDSTTLYRLDVRDVFEGGAWHEQPGAILMQGPIAPKYEYGDLLELEAKLETPPSLPDFDYRDYLASRGIASLTTFPHVTSVEHGHGDWLRSQMIDVRSRLSRVLSDVLPEPHASLAAGILFGERSSIPNDLRDDMRDTGTSHLVAVSGQNVTIVAAMIIAALAWLIGRRPAAWVSLAAIAGYALLVGVQPSVVRAAIMGAVYVLATISGRQHTSAIALMFAAALMTAVDPRVVDDVSFQLSFSATFGLATLAGPLRERLQSTANQRPAIADFPLTRPVIEMFSVTIAAVLLTMPISAVYFGQISLAAPVANLFVVPAFLAVGLTAGIAAAIDFVAPGLVEPTSWIAWPAAEYMIEAIRLFARVPGASLTLHGVTKWHAVAFYAALLAGTWWLIARPAPVVEPPPRPKTTGRRALLPVGGVAGLIALTTVVAGLAISQPERGRLSVTFLDVGQGDAILIEGPEGNRVLVDGGPGSVPITRALSRNMPFDDRRIDLVVLTHAQSDHMAGLLTVVERYDVGSVIDTALPGESGLYDAWESELHGSGATVTTANRGQSVDLGDGAALQVLAPDQYDPLLSTEDLNTASTVVRVTMGAASFLLTGDLDAPGEQALIRSGTNLQSTVLKVGHHGSKTSSTPAFVARVQPSIDVIEVGAANSFGHPAPEVLDRLSGDLVLRTDQDGDVTVSTDGQQIWVER